MKHALLGCFFAAMSLGSLQGATSAYSSSSSDFPNPERGFSVTMYWTNGGCVNVFSEDVNSGNFNSHRSANTAGESNITLVRRVYVLCNYTNKPFDSAVLNEVSNDCAQARSLGIKLALRFAYNWCGSGCTDASLSTVLGHLDQLAPLFSANADVIAFLQSGFVGEWGEWHDSTNGLTGGGNENSIIDKILSILPASRMTCVRYPTYKSSRYGSPLNVSSAHNGSDASRIGEHNDYFVSDSSDGGTYSGTAPPGGFKNWLNQDSLYTVQGGETGNDDGSTDSCPNTLSDLSQMRWSELNSEYQPNAISRWNSQGCLSQIKTNLGYRFRLVDSTVPASVNAGSNLTVSFNVANDGYANPYNPRLLQVILRQQGTGTILSATACSAPVPSAGYDSHDPRYWNPGSTTNVSVTWTIPITAGAGNYDVLLNLADPMPSLYDKPAYSMQLANPGVWESATGFNKLNHTLSIVTCGGCTLTFSPTQSPVLSATPSPTASPTSAAACFNTFADFELGSSTLKAPFTASWYTYADAGGSTVWANYASSPGANGSSKALRVTGIIMANNPPSFYASAALGTSLYWPDVNFNASTYAGIQFWFKGDGHVYRMNLKTRNISDGDYYGFNFTPPSGWTLIQFPFSSLHQIGWGLPKPLDLTQVFGFELPIQSPGVSFDYSIDECSFYLPCGALPTPTPSVTPALTATPSRTPSSSQTPSRTATVSSSVTSSLTDTPSITSSRTATSSTTASPSLTSSLTASATPTVTPTATASVSKSATPTATPSRSQTSTASASPTASESPTKSASPTPVPAGSSFTASPTLSPTRSSTPSATPSLTSTGSPAASASATSSPTATPTRTSSPAVTPSASATPSPVFSPTQSPTASSTPSLSASSSASPSATPTRTSSRTSTLTATSSPSPNFSPSATVSASATRTPSPNSSPSPTSSSTATSTRTPMSAPSPSSTTTSLVSEPTSALPGGPNEIDQTLPCPNPNPSAILLHFQGPTDRILVRIYSKAMTCLGRIEVPGPGGAGWHRVEIPGEILNLMVNGNYYCLAVGLRNGQPGQSSPPAKLMILK